MYALHTPLVRKCLAGLGVAQDDLDDVTQEVFIVVHGKRETLAELDQPDAWLREICRRVAAGYRRRAHRRREIYVEPSLQVSAEPSHLAPGLEQQQDEERLHAALGKLDDESRDLIALHSGELPLVDVAELLERDRKTVRKRLNAALRRLERLLGRGDVAGAVERPSAPPRTPSGVRPDSGAQAKLEMQVLSTSATLTVGLLGSVVIAVWPGAATLEALESLDVQFRKALETCTDGFAYLPIVEASTRPPTLEARKKIVELLQLHSTHIRIYATALQGGFSWIVKPVMTGLSLLARPPFPMEFFVGTAAAASWICRNYEGRPTPDATELTRAGEQLRALAMATARRAQPR